MQAEAFSESAAAVVDASSGKWGYINAKGEWIIEPKYDSAEPFLEEFAIVSLSGEYYLLNKNGDSFLFYTK